MRSGWAVRLAGLIAAEVPFGGTIAQATPADHLITAGVSHWGAYGLIAGLAVVVPAWRDVFLACFAPAIEQRLLDHLVERGPAVDGVTLIQARTIDGLDLRAHRVVADQVTAPARPPERADAGSPDAARTGIGLKYQVQHFDLRDSRVGRASVIHRSSHGVFRRERMAPSRPAGVTFAKIETPGFSLATRKVIGEFNHLFICGSPRRDRGNWDLGMAAPSPMLCITIELGGVRVAHTWNVERRGFGLSGGMCRPHRSRGRSLDEGPIGRGPISRRGTDFILART